MRKYMKESDVDDAGVLEIDEGSSNKESSNNINQKNHQTQLNLPTK